MGRPASIPAARSRARARISFRSYVSGIFLAWLLVTNGAYRTLRVSPTTGLPTGNAAQPTTVVVNVNGQRTGAYEVTKGVLRTLYEHNGSLDGLRVDVERSV